MNFAAGTILMFFVGGILSGTLALVPTMLQSLMDYPVFTDRAGDRAARHRHDGRDVLRRAADQPRRQPADHPGGAADDGGLVVADDGFSLQMGMAPVITSGVLQGFGLGLHLCPAEHLGTVEPAAAHHDPGHGAAQPDAQSRRQHRDLDFRDLADSEHPDRPFPACRAFAPGQPARPSPVSRGAVQPQQPVGLAALNAEVTRQASMVAYIDVFTSMMIIVAAMIPLLLVVRPPQGPVWRRSP